jgi:hypothetical protein
VRGKGSKLGEPCTKVRLSQDRLHILHTNVVRANVASSKFHSTTNNVSKFMPKQFYEIDQSVLSVVIEPILLSVILTRDVLLNVMAPSKNGCGSKCIVCMMARSFQFCWQANTNLT